VAHSQGVALRDILPLTGRSSLKMLIYAMSGNKKAPISIIRGFF